MKIIAPRLFINIHPEVKSALQNKRPLVALESAVITHGLPQPHNLSLARSLEEQIRSLGVTPATIGILDGVIHIGLDDAELLRLSTESSQKISRRNFGTAIAQKLNGGTTVAGTLIAAHYAGIQVFATGGIGGVHRNAPFDVSADLPELSRTPMIVVCAGAKSILDLPATLEVLETYGVPILGYQTRSFPAFFSVESGLPVDTTVNSPNEIAEIARAHWALGIESAILVVVPPPTEFALPHEVIETALQQALQDAEAQNITGSRVTPFLLARVNQLTHGESMQTNLALLGNNARLAAEIAACLTPSRKDLPVA